MKQRVLSAALAICLCISSPLVAYAAQEDPLHQGSVLSEKTQEETVPNVDEPNAPAETEPGQEDVPEEEIPGEEIPEETVPGVNEPNTPEETEPGQDDVPEEEIPGQTNPGADEPTTPVEAVPEQENILPEEIPVEAVSLVYPSTLMTTRDSSFPTPTEIYESMIALKDQDQYKEGTVWTNDEPYSDSKGYYHWNGGLLNGKKISAVGCVAFAFTLSDAAFAQIPNDKIFMGIPFYGYDWTLPFVQGSKARSMGSVTAVNIARRTGSVIQYDEEAQTPFFEYTDDITGKDHIVWFENARSIQAKLGLIKEFGLIGTGIWNVMRYFPEGWLVINGMFDIYKAL